MDKPILEDCNSSELSSEDIKHYVPTDQIEKLEVDESVYHLLEYITLEWPSQSIDTNNKKLLLATNSEENDSKIIEFNFANTQNFKKIDRYTNVQNGVSESYNRVRYFGPSIIAISDHKLTTYNKDLEEIKSIDEKFAYGLAIDRNVYAGCKNGMIKQYNSDLNEMASHNIHTDAVESICVYKSSLYTASCDKTAKIFDTRSNNVVCALECDCDVNAIDYNKENLVITGDDKGVVRLYDIRMNKETETIEWHKTPISYVKWKNENEFVTCSDEQIAIWDASFDEEWEYHKYLRFVHQGQQFYKEVGFFNDVFVATSLEGLCLFSLGLDDKVQE